ncbi:hypothetical protein AYI69_g2246 [Smittium culicis]|uniref:Uncharacterized protein n=1 Tax=Smittium culicis TaxID=133412 RepID=A0A1R1YN25_9FUNG|nr:hypothetical protein AYI69_g2246 [Smittium culicis]
MVKLAVQNTPVPATKDDSWTGSGITGNNMNFSEIWDQETSELNGYGHSLITPGRRLERSQIHAHFQYSKKYEG